MQKLHNHYANQLKKHEQKLVEVKKKIRLIRIFRSLIFFGFITSIYFTYQIPNIPFFIGGIGVLIFGFLVSKHQNLKEKKNHVELKIAFNKTEISILEGNFVDRPDGKEFINSMHHYSNDIDLFGKSSFFSICQ